MLDIYREATRLIEGGRRGAIATIISTTGSTPGKECAKYLVRDDGSTVGTVGGGCTEHEVWKIAMEVIADDRPQKSSFRLTAATAAETGLLCGGEFEVFVEPFGNPAVVILGAGHCSVSLARLLSDLDYQVTVIDDRDTYASADRFPEKVGVQVRPFESALEDYDVHENTYIVIVTRGHEHDETCLRLAVATPARYIGLIGSRGKIGAIFKHLRAEGVTDDSLSRVRGPIGLDIGSRTPDEIAISIAAEVIAFRRGVAPEPRNPIQSSMRRATT